MQQLKKIAILVLTIMLVIVHPSLTIQAKDKDKDETTSGNISSKDEVIYATLEATGMQEEVFVVNLLNVTKPGVVQDFGDYTSVKNLSGLEEITQTGEKIEVDAEKGKLYYQGNMNDAELPWDFTFSYQLNGKEIEPTALIGNEGQLEIEIDVSENEQGNEAFFENYLLQISLPFDADATDNIQAEDAVIANAGKDELVTFTVMPEKEETFTVTADVQDFEMEGIDISGVPSTMSIDAPDTDDVTGDIKTLADAIQDVNTGVAELKQGISELNQGSSELASGSEDYMAGMNELDDSSSELIAGSDEMNQALQTLNNELQKVDDIDLDVLKELQGGVANLAESFKEAKEGLTKLRKSYKSAYKTLKQAIDAIPANNLSEEEINALYESDANKETIDQLVATYKAAQETKAVFDNVKQGFEIVDNTLGTVIEELDEAANQVNQFNKEIGGSLDDVNIDENISELTSGINQMATNYQLFHNGLVEYTGGVSELAKNYQAINQGIAELSQGTSELETGANELHRGTDKLARSTSDLPEEMTEEIDKMIDEYDKSDFDPVSFVAPDKNEDVFSVQFVLKTESLEKEEQEESKEVEEEKSFWEKFLDLFR